MIPWRRRRIASSIFSQHLCGLLRNPKSSDCWRKIPVRKRPAGGAQFHRQADFGAGCPSHFESPIVFTAELRSTTICTIASKPVPSHHPPSAGSRDHRRFGCCPPGLQMSKTDFHIHAEYSYDSKILAEEIVQTAISLSYESIAITEQPGSPAPELGYFGLKSPLNKSFTSQL